MKTERMTPGAAIGERKTDESSNRSEDEYPQHQRCPPKSFEAMITGEDQDKQYKCEDQFSRHASWLIRVGDEGCKGGDEC